MLALKVERENAKESIFRRCYDYAVTLGKLLEIESDMPTIAGRKILCANASASTLFDYYLRNMCLPFLDHLIDGLSTRFDKYDSIIHKMHVFVPSVIGMRKVEGNHKIVEITQVYRDDLPIPGNAFEEYSRWERGWKTVQKEDRPDSVAKALKVCNMNSYPNIYVLLKILGTVAVTCECESSESILKRLNTYLRISVGQNRTNIDACLLGC